MASGHEHIAQAQFVIALLALLFGLALALLVWLLAAMVAAIPPEDRQYKDAPPLGFRLLWWPIHWCSHAIARFVAQEPTAALPVKLRKAGLDYSLGAAQFVAARLICALLTGLLLCWIAAALMHSGATAWLQAGLAGSLCGWIYPALWLRDRIARRKSLLQKSLPFYLDIITLCVEAGLNFQGALLASVEKGPPGALRDEFQRVLRDIRAGKGCADALRAMGERIDEPSVINFVSAVIQAERVGMNLGPVLRAQADQRRAERFLRAEKLAMEAPVKLLFPLIAFIFPCTFIVLFFPLVMKLINSGL
jgi:tight adherence protein C